MKLSEKLPRDIMSILTPSPAPSRLYILQDSRNLEDRLSLDVLPDVGS